MAYDQRFKDRTFPLANSEGNCASWDHAQLAALYDIRDELKQLNRLLHCHNFIEIPQILRQVEKNTRKKKNPKAAKPKLRVVA